MPKDSVTKEEFSIMIREMRKKAFGAKQVNKVKLDARLIKASEADF